MLGLRLKTGSCRTGRCRGYNHKRRISGRTSGQSGLRMQDQGSTIMLQFEGDQTFSQPPAEVFAKLSDARFLVQCIPGSESVKDVQADGAVCIIRPGFAFIRGTLEVTLKVIEAIEGKPIRLGLTSKG